jgi:hypothetical protein
LEAAHAQEAVKDQPARRRSGRNVRSGRNSRGPGAKAGPAIRIARFKQARKEFIQVARIANLDSQAKAHAGELCEEMKQAFTSANAP